ncbi:MAG: hypothetical protein SO019_06640, partial [Lachnospiraceae bacterium]|nr:hypothetical protein [Lachnospiraceae bacterium]
PLIFAIYVIAGILAIVLFYNNGSRLSRRLDQSVLTENESVSAMTDSQESESAPDDTQSPEVVETPASETPETDTDDIIEGTDHAVSDAATSPVSDAAVADSENSGNTTEAAISTDEIADTDEPADQSGEETSEADAETDDTKDDGKTYYSYTVNSGVSSVRVRKTANRSSKIIGHVNGGETGYVIEKGDIRSKIVTKDGTVGYIYNEYITISEISKKDVPKKYR